MNRTIFFILIVSLCNACQPLEEDITLTVTTENVGLYVSGEVKEKGQNEYRDFRIDLNHEDKKIGRTFWNGAISEGELGTTYILRNYAPNFFSSRAIFGLQFWSDSLEVKDFWTSDELEDFFEPGKTFTFGEGPGYVEVLMKFPIGGLPYDFEGSRSSYLANAQGTMTITSLEDYDYLHLYRSLNQRSYGKLVRCTFAGQLGRYNQEEDQADGFPGFLTDNVIELKNCDILFYVEYDRI